MQIIINAGGGGSRLWPISTENLPKQFCKLIDGKSLLRITFERLLLDFEPDQIWIATNKVYKEIVKGQLSELLEDHILLEPSKRDTLPAICSHAALVASKTSKDESLIFITADHLITPQSSVKIHNQTLNLINQSLQSKQYPLIVAGISPLFPSPQYGYIELGQNITEAFGIGKPVVSFREKPSEQVAEKFIKTGKYLWNFGLFSFTFTSLEKIIENLYPDLIQNLDSIYKKKEITNQDFDQFPKLSFDYGVLEHVKNIGAFAMNLENWEDIGSFDILYENHTEALPKLENLEKEKSAALPKQIQIYGDGNKVRILNKEKKVAFVGVSNLLLVETNEGILVIDPRFAKEVKKAAEYFKNVN